MLSSRRLSKALKSPPTGHTNKDGVQLTERDFQVIGLKEANRKLIFGLHQACRRGDTLLKLMRAAPERIASTQLNAARIQLEIALRDLDNARITGGIPSPILGEANVQILFLNRGEQGVVAKNRSDLSKRESAMSIGQMNRDALTKALDFQDTSKEFKQLQAVFELFESEKACLTRLVELPEQAERADDFGKEIEALKINLFVIAKSLCILSCSNKARFEAVMAGAGSDLAEMSALGSGPIASYVRRMSELTKPSGADKPMPAATADHAYRDATMAALSSRGAEVRSLALEIANTYFVELSQLEQSPSRLNKAQLAQAEEILQTGFLTALKLIDVLDWTGDFAQQKGASQAQPSQFVETAATTLPDRFKTTQSGSDSEPDELDQTEVRADFEGLSLDSNSELKSNSAIERKALAALAEPVIPTLLKLRSPKSLSSLMPETAEFLLKTESAAARNLAVKIQKLLRRESLPHGLKASLQQKLHTIDQKLQEAKRPGMIEDLIKKSPVPIASDWVRLHQAGGLMQVGMPKQLPSESPLIEMSLQPKPLSTGEPAPKVWLHIHLKEGVKMPGQKKLASFLLGNLKNGTGKSDIEAAHLKSDFYRGKGKNWEKTQQDAGRMAMLVKRSPVPLDFVEALLNTASAR